ncbi:putative LysR-type transcriptional regulator domain protein, partial [Vibrio cholerae HC-50A1]
MDRTALGGATGTASARQAVSR